MEIKESAFTARPLGQGLRPHALLRFAQHVYPTDGGGALLSFQALKGPTGFAGGARWQVDLAERSDFRRCLAFGSFRIPEFSIPITPGKQAP